MPSATGRRRSRAVFEDDDTHVAVDSSRKKRPNGIRREERSETDSDDESSRTPAEHLSNRARSPAHFTANGTQSSSGDFAPGAIVRVLVNNFVTYERAEFFPGPNLNMVIGPNGTGKSSLVCAICLGLGYGPQHLGRASKVGEFVKLGKDRATIEIELQKRPGDRANHVIRVEINREDNQRKWRLNNKDSTLSAVRDLTASLHIQVDNLCQFLPQDKVAEFAGLTPVQLLHQTLRAAAPQEMLDWQKQLHDFHQEHKTCKEKMTETLETLDNLQQRQDGLQADVDRYLERDEIKKNIELLQKVKHVAEYSVARIGHQQARLRKKEAERNFKRLQESCGPALRAVDEKKEYAEAIRQVIRLKSRALGDTETTGAHLLQAVEKKQEEYQDVFNKIEGEKASFNARKGDVSKARRGVTDIEGKLKNKPLPFDAPEWNAKIREQEEKVRHNEAERRNLDTQLTDIKNLGRKNADEREKLEKQKEELASQEGQKLLQLRKTNQDAWKGWEWLKDNQDKFQKQVFGPPMLTCSIKDERYSNAVQALLRRDDFFCFVAQTRSDHKLLSDYFYKEMKLSVTIRTCGSSFADFRSPLPVERIRDFGFDGYAVDFLEAPEPVLAMFCAESKLHASLVGLRDIDTDQFNELTKIELIPGWVAGKTVYRVMRRKEYGDSATSTSTRQVLKGQFWTDQPVDNSETERLDEKLAELLRKFHELKEENLDKKDKIKTLRVEEQELRERIDDLRNQKSELQKAQTYYEGLPLRLQTEQQKLESAREALNECRDRANELKVQADHIVVEKARMVLEHNAHLLIIKEAHQELLDARIRLLEAESDTRGLEGKNSEIVALLEQEDLKRKELSAEVDKHKKKAAELLEVCYEAAASTEGGMDELNEHLNGRSPEDIVIEIGAEEAKMEMMDSIDPAILRQFERRAEDIKKLTDKRDQQIERLDTVSTKIDEIKEKWEPKVDELIGKINDAFAYNFEQISCAGEVGVHKDEDFEQWAIEIKVKFRQNETLQQLDQHRQSGGERAVSTIFYLMALQSMAQAPFRVVDEINQGMDPRNERMVHERMVEIACREHTSQYFLITPKLLTGLRYDERMRVLCIASGEHMPTEGRKMDFGKLVRIQRGIAAGA